MTRPIHVAFALALAACQTPGPVTDSGIPARDADAVERFELCEGCVIGCSSSGEARCVPVGDLVVGCQWCWPFCGRPSPLGLPSVAWCDDGVPMCQPGFDVSDTASCYRDLAR